MKICVPLLVLLLCNVKSFTSFSNGRKEKIGFIILSQENDYHYQLAEQIEENISDQAKNLNFVDILIYKSHKDFGNVIGHWTIFPLLEKLSKFTEFSWLFFLEDSTSIDLKKLLKVFLRYNSSENVFAGYALQDSDPTIIHHFAAVDETSILYPYFAAGFFISFHLIQKLASRLTLDKEFSFSIDPKYELAKFIWNEGLGTKLIHEPHLCLFRDINCASWIETQFPECGSEVPSTKISVAVKTCHKFHKDRVEVVKNTWAVAVKDLNFFSDEEDTSIPTIKLDIENVPTGHCQKTLDIMGYYVMNNVTFEWIAIVDDDTLINFHRLQKLLSCYDSSEFVAVGERYGFSVASGLGYDYITGGGGMIFSLPLLMMIVQNCQCPSLDSPDDMIIGMCLKRLNIPATHSPHFHQARPVDYTSDFLKPLKHISFHKHWMINPYSVYKEWLLESNSAAPQHLEL